MEKIINENGVIDTPIELLLLILACLIGIIVIFKIANFLEGLPVVEKKKKVKEKKIEISKESECIKKSKIDKKKAKNYIIEKESGSEKATVKVEKAIVEADAKSTVKVEGSSELDRCGSGGHVCPYASSGYVQPIIYNSPAANSCNNNYLYDRFVDNPTSDDFVMEKKISDAFMSDKDLNAVQNYSANIKVNNVEHLDKKASLHQRISQMTSRNYDTRERLLQEFEGLSKEMKLLIIDNIIQKM